VIVTARDEAQRIAATLAALRDAFPRSAIVVADDGSRDATAAIAQAHGAHLVSCPRAGKGQSATRGATRALELGGIEAVYVLGDADLGHSAGRLHALTAQLAHADLAIAAFATPPRAGFGLAIGFARWAVRRTTGRRLRAPISGQRALTGAALSAALPFAPGYGIELAMTIDALRAGLRVVEVELDLDHRRSGYAHRALQLRDFVAVYLRRAKVRR
jgi:glycosyltransferase involved in cell wall biosynthesis